MEHDQSALFFDTITRESGQFGFFQKRLFIFNTLIQSACVSVLLYTCATMPELDVRQQAAISSPNGHHDDLDSNLSLANKTALSAGVSSTLNISAAALLLSHDVVDNFSKTALKSKALSLSPSDTSTYFVVNSGTFSEKSSHSETETIENVLRNISGVSSSITSTYSSETDLEITTAATILDRLVNLIEPVATSSMNIQSSARERKEPPDGHSSEVTNLSLESPLGGTSADLVLNIEDERYKYLAQYNLTSPLPEYLANSVTGVGNFVTSTAVTSNHGLLPGNVTVQASGAFIFLTKELSTTEILQGLTKEDIVRVTSYAQAAGVAVGVLIGGMMADIFGRRKLLYISLTCMLLLQCCVAVSATWVIFIVVRILAAGCAGTTLVVSFVMVIEFVGPDWRDVCMCSCFWSLGAILLSLETVVTVHWRWLALLSGGLCLPVVATYFVSMESIRWLQCQHRFAEAEWCFREVVHVNTATVPDIVALLDQSRGCIVNNMHVKKFTYFDLFHSLNSTKWTMTLIYTSTVSSAVYFSLLWQVRDITSVPYVNGFLPFLIDLPLVWSVIVMNRCLGRRWCLFLYSLASGFSLLSVLILHITGNLDALPSLVTGLDLFGKIGVTASMAIIFIIATEMYPTVTRCMGVGVAVASASVGSILSHFLTLLESYHDAMPFVAYGAIMSSVGFAGLLFPETISGPLKNIQQCRHRKIPLMEGARLVGRPPRLWEAV